LFLLLSDVRAMALVGQALFCELGYGGG